MKKSVKITSKFSIYLAILFLAFISANYFIAELATLSRVSPPLIILYWSISLTTFFIYALDKFKAKRGTWRISEFSLHLLSLMGGWPGAAIAQQLLRHKSQKRTFRIRYWGTVLANSAALVWLLTP